MLGRLRGLGIGERVERFRERVSEVFEQRIREPILARLPGTRESFVRSELDNLIAESRVAVKERVELVNVVRRQTFAGDDVSQLKLEGKQQAVARVLMVGPDKEVVIADVAFPVGEVPTERELIRRASSDVGDQVDTGKLLISSWIRRFMVHVDYYIQEFLPK